MSNVKLIKLYFHFKVKIISSCWQLKCLLCFFILYQRNHLSLEPGAQEHVPHAKGILKEFLRDIVQTLNLHKNFSPFQSRNLAKFSCQFTCYRDTNVLLALSNCLDLLVMSYLAHQVKVICFSLQRFYLD